MNDGVAKQPWTLRRRRLFAAAVVLLIGGGSLGGLWSLSRTSTDIPFLPRYAPAHWIVYPHPYWIDTRHRGAVDAVFRRAFDLATVPRVAILKVRGFREFRALVNGQQVLASTPGETNWRQASEVDVADHLRHGSNEIEVVAVNQSSRPAIWVALEAGKTTLISDAAWTATYGGAVEQTAGLASDAQPRSRQRYSQLLTKCVPAFRSQFATIALFAAVAATGWGVGVLLTRKWRQPGTAQQRQGTWHFTILLLAVPPALWIALWANNQRSITRNMGFDAVDHLDYIDFIQTHRALPLPEDGREMHQPPLFYLGGAILLSAFGLDTHSDPGVALLRWYTLALGIANFGFIFAALRVIFPGKLWRPIVGLLFAAVLPMHLFIFQYINNESLTAVLSSASIYLALWGLSIDKPCWRIGTALGLALGAALLSKITAMVLVPVIFVALIVRLVGQRRYDARSWLYMVALPLLVMGATCGWHYYRVWTHYGTPLVRHIDLEGSEGAEAFKDPTFHTAGDLFRFGEALSNPFLCGFRSFPDAYYSTYWGDGRLGGRGLLGIRPAWNVELMAAGYLLALVPTVLMILGAALAAVSFLRRPTAVWSLILGIVVAMGCAMVYEGLRHPYLSVLKAWYSTPVTVALCAFVVCGADFVAARGHLPRALLSLGLGTWALCAYTTFWILPHAPATKISLAVAYADDERIAQAARLFEDVINQAPTNSIAHMRYGEMLLSQGDAGKAREQFLRGIEIDPQSATCHFELARIYEATDLPNRCIVHAREAVKLAPDSSVAYEILGLAYAHTNRIEDAIAAFREALRTRPTYDALHIEIAEQYARLGNYELALRHAEYAFETSRGGSAARKLIAQLMMAQGRMADLIARYEQIVSEQPDVPGITIELAWFLATGPSQELRNGARAVRLAKAACHSTGFNNAIYLHTLAAAYAEAGRLNDALHTAEQALQLSREMNEPEVSAEIQDAIRIYESGQSLRPDAMWGASRAVE